MGKSEQFAPGLYVYRSNRLDRLVDELANIMALAPIPDPVTPERVVVGSRGMQGWLFRQLAHRLGVCANLSFSFPAEMLDRLILLVGGAAPASAWEADLPADPWNADALVWGVLAELCKLESAASNDGKDPFGPLKEYLKDDRPAEISRRRYALARHVADVFDRYTLLRPLMARAWSEGKRAPESRGQPEDLAWQPLLWHDLQRRYGEQRRHLAARVLETMEKIEAGATREGLPPRVNIFGISALPPLHLQAFAAMARLVRINLFLPCPSQEYWADLRSARQEILRRRHEQQLGSVLQMNREELTASLRQLSWQSSGQLEGNPLLAACGRMARDFQVVLEDRTYQDLTKDPDAFVDPAGTAGAAPADEATALAWLQSDMLAARHPAASTTPEPGTHSRRLEPTDDSVQLHACHGPTRQVEALRDILLGLLQDHQELEPRDILVMTPEIETFAPLISAVFDAGTDRRRADDTFGPEGGPRLPYRIEDLTLRRANPVADALLRTMTLARGRAEAPAVLELLDLEPVQRRFGVDASDLPQVQDWIARSGVRWGIDAEHRAVAQQPPYRDNTWAFGLDRLALGICMDADRRLVSGVSPVGDMTAGDTLLAGKLLEFSAAVMQELLELREARPLEAWAARLTQTVARLTRTSAKASWLTRQVTDALEEMRGHGRAAALDQPLTLDAVTAHLDGKFEVPSGRVANSRGAVTFCGMMPMRSIPYRVICLLGMDEGAFPRKVTQAGFDLTAWRSRLGDRDPRDEDRLIFLEAVQSAGEHLVILYTGSEPRSGEPREPSVVVDELRELLDATLEHDEGDETPSRVLTTDHPLQAFSPENFRAHRPRSFHSARLEACQQLRRRNRDDGEATEAPFFAASPEEAGPSEAPAVVTLDDLAAFLVKPAVRLLNKGLGLYLEEKDDQLQDREPLELNGLEQWKLGDDLLRAAQDDALNGAALAVSAEGRLPLGNPGRFTLEERQDLARDAQAVYRRLCQGHEPRARLDLDRKVGDVRLVGTQDDRLEYGSLSLVLGQPRGKRVLVPWLKFLVWTAMDPEAAPRVELLLGHRPAGDVELKLATFSLEEMSAEERGAFARTRLGELVDMYLEGQRRPLPLFDRSSRAFADKIGLTLGPDDFASGLPEGLAPKPAKALKRATSEARKKWTSGWNFKGEDVEPHHRLAFGEANPVLQERGSDAGQVHPEFARLALLLWQPLLDRMKLADIPVAEPADQEVSA